MSNARATSPMPYQANLHLHYGSLLSGLEGMANKTSPYYAPVLDALQKAAPVVPSPELTRLLFQPRTFGEPAKWLDAVADQFMNWRKESSGAELITILNALCEQGEFDPNHPLLQSAITAAILGSVPNDLPFHSADHTREVVSLAVALASQHQSDKGFNDPVTQLLEIFIAACIHDFAHDGHGNARYGQHTPMRLEQNALDHALPFLKLAHIPDPSWERICVMVLSTDVSKPSVTYTSPAEWMRMANEGIGDDDNECPVFLAPLFDDPSLALQAALLEDADLGVSAGTPYEFARRMTALIAEETKVLAPSPETLIGFIDHICHGAFITDAAKTLYGDNIKRLRTQAREESADTIYQWS